MNDTMYITPSVIIRRRPDEKAGFQVADVPHEESGERALLIFASPEIAESFRANSGRFSEEEGFIVMPCNADELRAVVGGVGFEHIAVRGWESPDGLDFFDAVDFMWLLMQSEYDPAKPLG